MRQAVPARRQSGPVTDEWPPHACSDSTATATPDTRCGDNVATVCARRIAVPSRHSVSVACT
eukprot:5592275-Alexandrium_andersonii.AAC.1